MPEENVTVGGEFFLFILKTLSTAPTNSKLNMKFKIKITTESVQSHYIFLILQIIHVKITDIE